MNLFEDYDLFDVFAGFRYSIRAVQGASTVEPAVAPKKDSEKQSDSDQNWKIKMLYDGDCPLCMKEVML